MKQDFSSEILNFIKIINKQKHKAIIIYLIPENKLPKQDLIQLLSQMASLDYLCCLCHSSSKEDIDGKKEIEILEENLILVHHGFSLIPALKPLSAIILSTQNLQQDWLEILDHKLLWLHIDEDSSDDLTRDMSNKADLLSYFSIDPKNGDQFSPDPRGLSLKVGEEGKINPFLLEEKFKADPKGWQAYANLNLQGKIAVMTATFLDFDGEYFYSGGAERYLLDLAEICEELKRELVIFQYGNYPWMRRFKNIDIISLSQNGLRAEGWILKCAKEYNRIFYEHVQEKTALNIYSAFYESWPLAATPNIGISHGVSWDNPYCDFENAFEFWVMNQRYIEGAKSCEELVSVDTNSANWFQTVDFYLSQKIKVIPNYVDLSTFKPSKDYLEKREKTTILYPRQLYSARGLYLVLEIIDDILERYPQVEFHFVGRGGEQDIRQVTKKQEKWPGRVKYASLSMEEMPKAYQNADISLIPSVHSEGTSLSCLEAMASGNAIIATRVGGLSDLIINNYNGLLIDPRPGELKQAVITLLENQEQLFLFKKRNCEVASAFSKTLWRKRWKSIIDNKLDKTFYTEQQKNRVVEIKLGEGAIDFEKLSQLIIPLLIEGCLVYVRASTGSTMGVLQASQLSFARIQWLAPDAPLFSPCDLTIEF